MTLAETLDGGVDALVAPLGWDAPLMLSKVIVWAVLSVIVFSTALTTGGIFTFVFRKLFAFFGQRLGPNRVGPWGVLQFLADGVKLVFKEDITPRKADWFGYHAAVYIVLVPFVTSWAVIPFSDRMVYADLKTGALFLVAVSAIPPLGEIVAGWASNNKYSLWGGLRAAALDVSYEVPLVLVVLSVVLLSGSLSLNEIVKAQENVWFILPLLPGAFIFFMAMLAKGGLIPTDLPESESELVAGYTTEYSGMRFGMFFVGLFASIFFLSALTTTFFFGGWQGPSFAPPLFWFLLKTYLLCFVVFWLWCTLPRVRPDQYMTLAWKVLFPLALAQLVFAVVVKELGWV